MDRIKGAVGTARDCWAVAKWAIKSRIFMLLLQVLLHNIIPDHQGSMDDVFMKIHRIPEHPLIVDGLFGGLDNWDAEYFIFNAKSGYNRHEQTMAFFPLLPTAMWMLSNSILLPLILIVPQRSVLLISGVLINFLAFPFAAISLYLLTLQITYNKKLSLLAALLFCFNPASVFMSAVYSETLFSLFTFSGVLALEKKWSWLCAMFFSLATATRSNGIVLCGYLAYQCLLNLSKILMSDGEILKAIKFLFITALQCFVVIAPFCVFQYYGYTIYCTKSAHSQPVWCNWSLPIPYTYIQEHYWNVGFLRYFQLKQVPNFVLASPMVLLSLLSLLEYFKSGNPRLRPYAFHLLFLLLFGVFNMHIQVLTRFICSSSPMIYWLSSTHLLRSLVHLEVSGLLEPKYFSMSEVIKKTLSTVLGAKLMRKHIITKAVVVYFLLYILLGFMFHCNFYPWT